MAIEQVTSAVYSDSIVSPELEKRIDEVHQSFCDGECVECSSKDELETLLESLWQWNNEYCLTQKGMPQSIPSWYPR